MKINKQIYRAILIAFIFLTSCAQINPLQGGSKDSYAPKIDSIGTYPLNGQINFKGNEITIKFNEYIALNKPSDNIIITPQLKTKPIIEVKNKKFTLIFKEDLIENTTYTISFNHAITDITEKNDSIFQFVFSTGNYIDSLSIAGKITDGFTNKPEKDYLVGLYSLETLTPYDSIPFKDQPIYIAQTNQLGIFKMNYLKAGDYTVFAIEDQNKNLKLDPLEKRGFSLDQKITIGLNNDLINVRAYNPEITVTKLKATKFEYPGKLEFIFNSEPENFTVKSGMDLLKEDSGNKDSLVFWLDKNPTAKMKFIISLNGEIDTIKPLYKGTPETNDPVSLSLTNNLVQGKLLPNKNLEVLVSEPIKQTNNFGFHLMTIDSIELDMSKFNIKNLRTLSFDSLNPQVNYLKIDSGAITSFYNHTNLTDEWLNISFLKPDYFGSLILNIDTVYQTPVFIELLNDKNEIIRTRNFQENIEFLDLIPGKYQVRLIFDTNNDGKWTTGSIKDKRLPEKVIYNKDLIDIKSRWEKEVDWIIEN